MSDLVEDLVALCRHFGMVERDQVCCGTVTVQQCVALQALLEGPSEAGPLAERLGSSPSATTRLVDGLVGRGWVARERDAADRRRVHVALTGDGAAEARRLRAQTATCIDLVMQQIPQDKREQVAESIRLVRAAVEHTRDALQACCG